MFSKKKTISRLCMRYLLRNTLFWCRGHLRAISFSAGFVSVGSFFLEAHGRRTKNNRIILLKYAPRRAKPSVQWSTGRIFRRRTEDISILLRYSFFLLGKGRGVPSFFFLVFLFVHKGKNVSK